MARSLIVISLAAFIFFSNPTFVAAESVKTPVYIVEESIQQQILAATPRITMVAREKSAGEQAYAVSNGLGTLGQGGAL